MLANTNYYIPHACGIDALYYFAKSGAGYNSFFTKLIEELEDKKREFEILGISYQDNDIIVKINDIDIKYSGAGRDGFHWFNHDYFRVGFKDTEKAQNIHNIRVQLNSIGIYTLGIVSLVDYVNNEFLKGILSIEKYFPVTRIDVNMFIQHDFKYLRKEMILSKKKNHSANISERSSAYELETYYVGKKPFLLRIYNKLRELENASDIKREIMLNHFGVNDMDITQPIFNVEFELHREFLTQYGIDTIEQALKSSKRLFELGCDLIKVLDVSELSEKQIYSSNRKRAPLNPVWEYITNNYDNREFLQIETPLEKIEKYSYRYSLEDAHKPIKRQISRLLLHDNHPTLLYFYELLQSAKEEFEHKQQLKLIRGKEQPVQIVHETIKPKSSIVDDLKTYSDQGLQELNNKLNKDIASLYEHDEDYKAMCDFQSEVEFELSRRGLVEFPF